MFAQVYVVVLTLALAQFAFVAATCSRTYKVKEGDFCDKISQEQHVSTFQLAATNPSLISQGCSNLQVGEFICLGSANEDCSTTQIVKAGDTCEKIAAANGLNMTILRMNNPQLDKACNIYAGEVLCTSKTVQVPPIPSGGIPMSTAVSKSAPPPPRSTSTSSFPGVVTIMFPSPIPVSTDNDVIKHTSSRPAIGHTTSVSAPQPTELEGEFPLCDEL